jgi:nicotinate phosphoribosyltransferase
MVGFISTSNVEAARRHGLVAAGTMAHSYIEAFPTEVEAFRAYAEDFPGRVTFLVDTYDTLTGIKHAIATIKEFAPTGRLGIRIDSGDLVALSVQGRKMLDQAGLPHVRIVASGGLDEFSIDQLVRGGAKIDAFGVGTRMGVSADHPYLDTAYKLVSYQGRPVMKLSRGKVSAPGRKQVFRRLRPFSDLVGLHDEDVPPGRERLLEPVMIKGKRRAARSGIAEAKARFAADLERLPAAAKDIRSPKPPLVRHTPALRAMESETHRRLVAGLKLR